MHPEDRAISPQSQRFWPDLRSSDLGDTAHFLQALWVHVGPLAERRRCSGFDRGGARADGSVGRGDVEIDDALARSQHAGAGCGDQFVALLRRRLAEDYREVPAQ